MFKLIFRTVSILTIASLALTSFSITSVAAAEVLTPLSDTEISTDTVFAPINNDLVEFNLEIRWGYVRGNALLDLTEKKYDGSVTTGETDRASLSLVKTLLFEKNDKIISSQNPVAWQSKINGHWDGLNTQVITTAEAKIIVKSGDFTISKTGLEWFALNEPAIVQTSDGQMLVVKVNKKTHRRQGVVIWWGKRDQGTFNCITYPCYGADAVDWSGSLTTSDEVFVKLNQPLRFESSDSITAEDRKHIAWTSQITTDRDGLRVLFLPNRNAAVESGFTLTFDNIKNGAAAWSKKYSWQDIKNGTRDTLKIDGIDYVVAVGANYITRQLVKAHDSRRLYLMIDSVKHEVTTDDVLVEYGYTEDEATIMEEADLESYKEGGTLNYPDGTVVEDTTGTYVIENGLRRRLANQNVINELTQRRRFLIKRASLLRLGEFPIGREVTDPAEIPDGSLVKVAGDSAVWKIVGNTRQVFPQLTIFNLYRLNFNKVRTITSTQLQQFNWAAPVKYPDGALVKIPTDPKVYLLRAGVRHWIETEDDLRGLGFDFSDIVDMPPTDIVNYPEGEPVITD